MLSFISDEEANSKDTVIKAIESKIAKVEALKSICDVFIEKYQKDGIWLFLNQATRLL